MTRHGAGCRSVRASRRAAGAVLVGALVVSQAAGCADADESDRAGEPRPSHASSSPAQVAHTLVAIESATAAGGTVSARPVELGSRAAVRRFVAGLSHGLPGAVRRRVRETAVPTGQALLGAVVAIGCDTPTEVTVTADPLRVTAVPVPSPLPECFAPVTSVALVLVDAARLTPAALPGGAGQGVATVGVGVGAGAGWGE